MLSLSFALLTTALLSRPTLQQPTFHPPTECGLLATFSTPGIPEAQGRSADLIVWALVFNPLEAHRDIKIVWRVTGAGAFQVRGYQPSGATVVPDRVQEHDGSTWQKPGDEWGTFFNFPAPGCWDLHVTRGESSGDLWINVKQPSEEKVSKIADPGVTAPVLTHEVKPNYTGDAIRRKVEGKVVLAVVVKTDGTVRDDVLVVESLDPDLDAEAIKAAKQWTFKPGTKDDKPVNVSVRIEMTFTLRK